MACRACGLEHSPLERCEIARRRLANTSAPVVHGVANDAPEVANTPTEAVSAVANTSTTYRYRDPVARRAYQRELMRRRRAGTGQSVA